MSGRDDPSAGVVGALALAAACALGLLCAGCEEDGSGSSSTRTPARESNGFASAVASTTLTIQTSGGFGPISYFQDRCANCHGNFGDQLLPTMRSATDDAYLHEQNRAMVFGPAQSSLTDRELTLLSAYVRSIFDQRPFAIVTSAQGSVLSGEASPGATISVIRNDTQMDAQREGVSWRAQLPALETSDRLVLRASDAAGLHSSADLHTSPLTATRP